MAQNKYRVKHKYSEWEIKELITHIKIIRTKMTDIRTILNRNNRYMNHKTKQRVLQKHLKDKQEKYQLYQQMYVYVNLKISEAKRMLKESNVALKTRKKWLKTTLTKTIA